MDQQILKNILEYDPSTGLFTWKIKNCHHNVGDHAGVVHKNGYVCIGNQRAHRLAFLFMTGSIPNQVDHIDLNKSNNRWSNLRSANNAQNSCNSKQRKHNKSGFKGVVFKAAAATKPWYSSITVGGDHVYLGNFSSKTMAALAYDRAAIKYFGEYARTNFGGMA